MSEEIPTYDTDVLKRLMQLKAGDDLRGEHNAKQQSKANRMQTREEERKRQKEKENQKKKKKKSLYETT